MTLLRGRSRERAGGAADVATRLVGLDEVVSLGEGRIDPDLLDDARGVLTRAGERLRLSAEHTVVALAGATGSGKSSLFNAVAGLELSPVGVRRPTTSTAHACVWGPEGAGPLLEWLGVPRRHQVARESVLDAEGEAELHGLVLLDLPDHDSTELAHRLEVDRLVAMVDLLVWVVDPQKYADAALHERYLRPLAGHGDVTVVVLNQVDRLAPDAVEVCLRDLRRLLADDGLPGVRVLPASTRTGAGLADLRELLREAVQERAVRSLRVAADVDRVAARLAPAVGSGAAPEVGRGVRAELAMALAAAAGVPVVGHAVERSTRIRAAGVTGWPFTRWVRRLRPDPLRRLHLDRATRAEIGPAGARTSLPEASPVARSQVDTATRRVAEAAGAGLPPLWAESVRRAARAQAGDLPDELDRAVAGTDLGVDRTPAWWRMFGALQWLLAIATLVGLGWLTVIFALNWFALPDPPTYRVGDVPVPTLLALGGAAVGLFLALLARLLARVGARRRRRRAEARLRAAVAEVGDRLVVAPVEAELVVYSCVTAALGRAKGRGRG